MSFTSESLLRQMKEMGPGMQDVDKAIESYQLTRKQEDLEAAFRDLTGKKGLITEYKSINPEAGAIFETEYNKRLNQLLSFPNPTNAAQMLGVYNPALEKDVAKTTDIATKYGFTKTTPETQFFRGETRLELGQNIITGSTPVQSPPPPQGLQVQQNQPISGTPQQGTGKLPPEALNYTGPSIVDFLNLSKQPSDFTSRTKLAQQYGIQNYTGTAEQNTQLLNTLRQPAKTPINASTSPVGTSLTPTADIQPTPASDTSFGDIFASAGIQGISSPTTTKIEDVIQQVSTAFGLTDVNKEMEEVSKEMSEEIMKTQLNPWLSNSQLSRKLSLINEKYERRKDALVNQLRLQQDVVGKSIDIYYKEKDLQQQNLFKALTLRENQIVEENKLTQQEFENQLAMERLGLERIRVQQAGMIEGAIVSGEPIANPITGETFIPNKTLTTKEKEKVNDFLSGESLINQLETMYYDAVGSEYKGVGSGVFARIKGLTRFTGQVLGLNQVWTIYQNFLDSNMSIVAKGLKREVGVLTDLDIARAAKSFPGRFSSPQEAKAAFDNLREQLRNNKKLYGEIQESNLVEDSDFIANQ